MGGMGLSKDHPFPTGGGANEYNEFVSEARPRSCVTVKGEGQEPEAEWRKPNE